MKNGFRLRRMIALLLCLCLVCALGTAAAAAYMPDVTGDMSRPSYWSALQERPSALLMTPEEIAAQNAANIAQSGTNMYDLKNAPETINGVSQREALLRSGKADAEYYFGWTYQTDGSAADEAFYRAMVENMADPNASEAQPVRYAVAVTRTTLHTFPSNAQILDDPADPEFDYQHLTGVRVNEPLVIYAESADGAFYLVHLEGALLHAQLSHAMQPSQQGVSLAVHARSVHPQQRVITFIIMANRIGNRCSS